MKKNISLCPGKAGKALTGEGWSVQRLEVTEQDYVQMSIACGGKSTETAKYGGERRLEPWSQGLGRNKGLRVWKRV